MALALIALAACEQYDPSKIWDKLQEHEGRIAELERQCSDMNTNISSMQTVLQAIQDNDFVTGTTKLMEGGVAVGYTITFSKSGSVTVYHGKDGSNGADGADGANGTDGAPGKDGYSPVVGLKQDADGVYCWTLDGEWILD